MKLETLMKDNFVGCYDEARGIALSKNRILQDKNGRCLSYFQKKLLNFAIIFFADGILSFFVSLNWMICLLVILILIADVMYLVLSLYKIYSAYKYRKSQGFKSSIIVDKEGITDTSYHGIKMIFSQDKILGVVLGKYTITILTDTPYYFYFPISQKDEVLKALKKYNKNIFVI